ncbi:MAG: amidohydrolase family protein [bacterium]|nr:amidohydrolase family protein [bacterium]
MASYRSYPVTGPATKNGAIAMGMESEFGTLEPGKRANFVILNRNPLQDITEDKGNSLSLSKWSESKRRISAGVRMNLHKYHILVTRKIIHKALIIFFKQ